MALTGFGLFGVSFVSVGIGNRCIFVPFGATFPQKASFIPKRTGAHDRPLHVDSTDLMAEREGFGTPVPLRVTSDFEVRCMSTGPLPPLPRCRQSFRECSDHSPMALAVALGVPRPAAVRYGLYQFTVDGVALAMTGAHEPEFCCSGAELH